MSTIQPHTPRLLRRMLAVVIALIALCGLGTLAPARAAASTVQGVGSAHGELGASHATTARRRGCELAPGAATAVRFGVIRDSGRRLTVSLMIRPGHRVAASVGCGSFAARLQVTMQRGAARTGMAVIAMPEVYVARRRLHAGHQVLTLHLPGSAPAARDATLRLAILGIRHRGTRSAQQTISARLRVRSQ